MSECLSGSLVAWVCTAAGGALLAWMYRLNAAMLSTPPAALAASPKRWSKGEILETFDRVKKNPVDWTPHLPPKLGRRYIVVGGSGLVGGQIVLQLLALGQPPEAIRIVDLLTPSREDMATGLPAQVGFVQADIASYDDTTTAFAHPWPQPAAKLPLTVFHTAAVIRPSERSALIYGRCERVNVGGTANCLAAAQAAGADVFIYTSSCSVSLVPVDFWSRPWRWWPGNYCQVMTEADFFRPLKEHGRFFANYAKSKAVAERLVCEANEIPDDPTTPGGFRTGSVRPGSAIYGYNNDLLIWPTLRMGTLPTFSSPWVQNWVHAGNVALGHLQYEAALLGPHAQKVAGRPFLVTDAGPPMMFEDIYSILRTISTKPPTITYPPPVLMLILAHLVEAYCVALARFPLLQRWLREPEPPLYFLQPACFSSSASCLTDDSAARRPVEEGGLGYRPVSTTAEGMCMQIAEWNTICTREELVNAVGNGGERVA